jgi:hypothetical protein
MLFPQRIKLPKIKNIMAPNNPTSATITASFAGDSEYDPSNGASAVTVQFSVTLTFRKPDGSPLANVPVYYGFSPGGGENIPWHNRLAGKPNLHRFIHHREDDLL